MVSALFCLVVALYETYEYAYCYDDEKKEYRRKLKEAARDQTDPSNGDFVTAALIETGNTSERTHLLSPDAETEEIAMHVINHDSRPADLSDSAVILHQPEQRHNEALSSSIMLSIDADDDEDEDEVFFKSTYSQFTGIESVNRDNQSNTTGLLNNYPDLTHSINSVQPFSGSPLLSESGVPLSETDNS